MIVLKIYWEYWLTYFSLILFFTALLHQSIYLAIPIGIWLFTGCLCGFIGACANILIDYALAKIDKRLTSNV